MQKPALPNTEQNRLAVLKNYDVLDTLPEKLYDNIALIASQICGTPIGLISLLDETRQWFKSRVGLDTTETTRDLSFCGHAILQSEVFQISNAEADPRFFDNPLVSGFPRVVFYAGAPLKTPSGEQIGTLCVIDHKPRTLSTEQTSALTALAEQVVALLEARLSVRAANEATKAKSAFLATMSHEIRTPLGAILGFTEILQENGLTDAERNEYLEIVNRSGKTLSHLVDDILDLSKVEANQMNLELVSCPVSEVLAGVRDLFGNTAQNKNIQLIIEHNSALPERVILDSCRVRQILTNIIGNAIKFTTQGSIRLKTTYENGSLFFSISDTGRGISKEQSQKLFQAFTQADSSTTREYGGTGLGLYLTRKICELHGGSFHLEASELGKGSTFVASVKADLPKPVVAVKAMVSGVSVPAIQLEGYRLLVVDDSPDNRMLFQMLLKHYGANIETASDGKEGYEKALAGNFDAVFMDIQMPVMDGHEATQSLRKAGFSKPIVALTAHAMKEEQKRALESGFSQYLSKPIDRGQLFKVLENICPPRAT